MHAEEGSLRLAGGATAEGRGAQFGRLEVFYRGGWGTACALEDVDYYSNQQLSFSEASVQVACRELGFESSFALQPLVRALMHSCTTCMQPLCAFLPATRENVLLSL